MESKECTECNCKKEGKLIFTHPDGSETEVTESGITLRVRYDGLDDLQTSIREAQIAIDYLREKINKVRPVLVRTSVKERDHMDAVTSGCIACNSLRV